MVVPEVSPSRSKASPSEASPTVVAVDDEYEELNEDDAVDDAVDDGMESDDSELD